MHFPFIKILSIIVIFATVISCKNENEYRVDAAFTEYVARFEMEGKNRGRDFDLKKSGLIIEFADLKDETAGLCHYEKPIRIEIDKEYWENIGNSNGGDLMKENLIFHEMGHGILGRRHINTTLENDDWKSIMCGGEKVDNRPWNINYKGIRREYYLDELFNESTPAPAFSSLILPIDTTVYSEKLHFDFNSPENSAWSLSDNEKYRSSLEGERFRFDSKITNTYFVLISTQINIQSDFMFELEIESLNSNFSTQHGMLLGANSSISGSSSIEYFNINYERYMFMGNSSFYSYFTRLSKPQIRVSGSNLLKIAKKDGMMYYFINNQYVYCSEMEVDDSGFHFGFLVPPMTTVLVDNLKIKTIESQKVLSSQTSYPIQFKGEIIESGLNQGEIRK